MRTFQSIGFLLILLDFCQTKPQYNSLESQIGSMTGSTQHPCALHNDLRQCYSTQKETGSSASNFVFKEDQFGFVIALKSYRYG